MIWFLVFNCFSVYYVCQMLQMSFLISKTSHNPVSGFSLIYDALYSLLVILGLHQLHKMADLPMKHRGIYTLFCHIGAVLFALSGEIPFLHGFSLTSGFWERLPPEGKVVILLVALIIGVLCCIQARRVFKKKKCKQQILPFLVMVILWLVLWFVIFMEKIPYHIHVHHALFAGLFSCWFNDFNSLMDIIMNAILIGIVIEGIDFYGIGELSLYMIGDFLDISVLGILVVWIIVFIGLIFSIYKKNNVVHMHYQAL